MKIVHFSDLHLGIESYGVLNPETGLSARLEDFLAALDRVVQYSLEEGVDLVVFCGDAYQRKDPTQTYQREFARRLLKLSRSGIPILLVPGNHDLHPAPGKASSVDIFSVLTAMDSQPLSPDPRPTTLDSRPSTQIYSSRRPQIFNISTTSGPIQILSIPWLFRSSLLAKEEYKSLSFDALNQEMSQKIAEFINQEMPKISPEYPALLASHIWVTGSKVGSEQRYTLERDYSLPPGSLALPVFDYVALGHIHRKQAFDLDPPVAYSGSLERIDFSDEDVPKGFYIVEIDAKKPRAKRESRCSFEEIPARRFLTIEIRLKPDEPSPEEAIFSELSRHQEKVKGSIVRLKIQWPHASRPRLQDSEIRKALKEAFIIAGIKWEMEQPTSGVRIRNVSSAALSPLEALDEYLKWKTFSPEEASELHSHAQRLLKEMEPE